MKMTIKEKMSKKMTMKETAFAQSLAIQEKLASGGVVKPSDFDPIRAGFPPAKLAKTRERWLEKFQGTRSGMCLTHSINPHTLFACDGETLAVVQDANGGWSGSYLSKGGVLTPRVDAEADEERERVRALVPILGFMGSAVLSADFTVGRPEIRHLGRYKLKETVTPITAKGVTHYIDAKHESLVREAGVRLSTIEWGEKQTLTGKCSHGRFVLNTHTSSTAWSKRREVTGIQKNKEAAHMWVLEMIEVLKIGKLTAKDMNPLLDYFQPGKTAKARTPLQWLAKFGDRISKTDNGWLTVRGDSAVALIQDTDGLQGGEYCIKHGQLERVDSITQSLASCCHLLGYVLTDDQFSKDFTVFGETTCAKRITMLTAYKVRKIEIQDRVEYIKSDLWKLVEGLNPELLTSCDNDALLFGRCDYGVFAIATLNQECMK